MRAVGEPYERSLGPHYQRLEADVARLERAQQARDQFLADDPSALERLAELGRAVKTQESLERQRHWHLPYQRAQQQSFHHGHDLGRDRGPGSTFEQIFEPWIPCSRQSWGQAPTSGRHTRRGTAWVMSSPPGELSKVALAATLPGQPANCRPPPSMAAGFTCHPGCGQVDGLVMLAAVQNPTVRGSRGEGRRPKRSCRLSTSAAH